MLIFFGISSPITRTNVHCCTQHNDFHLQLASSLSCPFRKLSNDAEFPLSLERIPKIIIMKKTHCWNHNFQYILCGFFFGYVAHRITARFGLEGTLKPTQFQPPATGRAAAHQVRLPRTPSNGPWAPPRMGHTSFASYKKGIKPS